MQLARPAGVEVETCRPGLRTHGRAVGAGQRGTGAGWSAPSTSSCSFTAAARRAARIRARVDAHRSTPRPVRLPLPLRAARSRTAATRVVLDVRWTRRRVHDVDV